MLSELYCGTPRVYSIGSAGVKYVIAGTMVTEREPPVLPLYAEAAPEL